jgi:hypothetical protein
MYLMGTDIESKIHNQEWASVSVLLLKRIEGLEEQNTDLKYRMNAVCNFMTLNFNNLVDPITMLSMTEEGKND